ncbi:MAG: aryl-sulfate sulfotransferase [Clostridium sp.]
MNNLINEQLKIIDKINSNFAEGKYTLENPLVVLNPFKLCPLSALLKFRTKKKCSVTIKVFDKVINRIEEVLDNHEIAVVGLYPDKKNKITIVCKFIDGCVKKNNIYIKTNKLPEEYPTIDIKHINEEKMADGFIGMSLSKSEGVKSVHHLYSIIDKEAQVRWLYLGVSCHVFSKLKNGNIIVDAPASSGICGAYTSAGFIEMDFLGKIIHFYKIPNGLHHDVIELPNNNFLAITQRENTKQDLLVEIERKSKKIIKEWDFRNILDFNRQTVIDKISVNHPLDWLHLNSIIYDDKSNCIIASSRNQSTVVKFDKDTSEIKWILSPDYGWNDNFKKYLLKPVGENFQWSYAQHTPRLTKDNNLMIFDNGNFRSYSLGNAILAHNNYSRGVEYNIDEEKMTVEQVWQYGKERGNLLYCAYLGAINILSNENRLICFGGITKDIFGNPTDDMKSNRMKNRVTIIEISKDEVVFEISMEDKDITKATGYKCYRAEKLNF